MDKTNLFGKRSAKPTIQLDAETGKRLEFCYNNDFFRER